MLNKIKLFYKIRKFYKIFGSEIGANFITKLSEMTKENVNDVIFDINEALEGYDDHKDEMAKWLRRLRRSIKNYREPRHITAGDIVGVISFALLLWGALSILEVGFTDPLTDTQYSSWNLWVILLGGVN